MTSLLAQHATDVCITPRYKPGIASAVKVGSAYNAVDILRWHEGKAHMHTVTEDDGMDDCSSELSSAVQYYLFDGVSCSCTSW